MEKKEILKIPYVVHEAAMYRKERIIKSLIAALACSHAIYLAVILLILK